MLRVGNDVSFCADSELFLWSAYVPNYFGVWIGEYLAGFVCPDVRSCRENRLSGSIGSEESPMEECPHSRLPIINCSKRIACRFSLLTCYQIDLFNTYYQQIF